MEERDLYAAGIALSGVVLVALQLFQGVQQLTDFTGTDLVIVFVIGTLPFVIIALALAFVGAWLYNESDIGEEMRRVFGWWLSSSLLFGAVASLLVFTQVVAVNQEEQILSQAPFIVVNLVTVGGFAGMLVGIYDAQSQQRKQGLERERDRVESFAKKAADINNYGRELNRCESADEVSSLCLEAMQTFLGLTNLAFVITDEDETEFVDNTTVGISEERLVELVQDSLDQDHASVVTHELSDDIERDLDSALSLLITTHEDTSTVLLALTDDAEKFENEDIQLLEMLVSHAATALDQIYEQNAAASTA
jgi:uncharacterized membrane protein YidH (DUF202 family)